jgi:hypothetical protein
MEYHMGLQHENSANGKQAAGHRCRTNRLIRTHAGNVPPLALGTIVAEIDNLGRHMLQVLWDGGFSAYVFPEEIEIVVSKQ